MIGPPDYNQKYEESPDGMKPHLEASPKQIPRRHYSNRHDDFEYVRRPAPARRVLYEPGDPEFTRGITSKRIGGWAKRGGYSSRGHLKRRIPPSYKRASN